MQGPIVPGLLVSAQPHVSTTTDRPKLHYHRSGVVRASLSGTNIEAATSQYQPIPERGVGTMISIVVTQPFQLMRRELRKGDMANIVGDWPQSVTTSITVIPPGSRDTSLEDEDGEDVAPIGLVKQTPSQFVVDLRGYGHSLLLLVDERTGNRPALGTGPTITITAYPESPDRTRPTRAHALWNASARNPLLGYQEEFLWEADRSSWAYRSGYIGRFNRFPPWEKISGTPIERPLVLLVRLLRHAGRFRERVLTKSVTTWQ